MALYRRGRVWWCRFTAPDGSQIRRSTKTRVRKDAQEYEDKLRAEFWRVHQLGESKRRTWREAVERYVKEQGGLHPRHQTDLRFADKFLGGLYLDQITRDVIDDMKAARSQSKSERGNNRGFDRDPDELPIISPATVNRLLEWVRAILRRAAYEWHWIQKPPSVRMLPNPDQRVRWITREEAERLISASPDHLANLIRFSLATGLRKKNALGLTWDQVDMKRKVAWIHPDQAKGRQGKRQAIGVPLNSEAMRVLERVSEDCGRYVFTYEGQPISDVKRSFHTALRRAGIENFKWHDLRHTWASWHVQNGTPLHVLQHLGGWSSIRMVQKYAHLAPEHLASWAESMAQNRAQPDENNSQNALKPK